MKVRRCWSAWGLLLAALWSTPPAWGQATTVPSGRLGADDRIEIDGLLSDPAWQRATWFSDFIQSVPEFGEPATEPTHVAFMLDDHAVYIGVRCDDSAPELIRARKLRHRDNPQTDDHIEIVFDTYRDQVRGTLFVVNPLGAKEEALVNGYQRYTWDWNEVWQVGTAITGGGWQAELRIPLRLLRYRTAPEQEWGVNVKRVVRRLQEESYLAAVPPPYDISSLNFAGVLAGLELGTRQRNLQLTPYALGGELQKTDDVSGDRVTESIGEVGFDLKYSITSDLTAEHGVVDWQLWSLRLDYTHSSTLSASAFVQYNSSRSSTDINLRLRKILGNDSDLFVVFNERAIDDGAFGTLSERDLAVKISYRLFL